LGAFSAQYFFLLLVNGQFYWRAWLGERLQVFTAVTMPGCILGDPGGN